MKLAIVPDKVIAYLREYCNEMEDVIEDYKDSPMDGEDKDKIISKVMECSNIFHHIQHVVLAYETMFVNACDPALTHIDFNPKIKAFLDSDAKPIELPSDNTPSVHSANC